MGRAGGGRSGGGSRSSGGRSGGSRSSGGHRSSSSSFSSRSRAGSGSSYGGFGGFSGSRTRMPHYNPHPHHHNYHGPIFRRHYSTYGSVGSPGCGCGSFIYGAIILFIIAIIVIPALLPTAGNITPSTINREKLENTSFINNCVVDEIGWVDNPSTLSKELKDFFTKTGVQPYIVLLDYNPDLKTDAEKVAYSETWYEENIDNEYTFLFMYFAERDVDNDVGYMTYVNGYQVSTVMDAEAVEIFWDYIDAYWYTDLSTDDLFATVFSKTADRIMQKTTTSQDVQKTVWTVVGIVAVGVAAYFCLKLVFKRKKEEAEETIKILNTPLEHLPDKDPLVSKYADDEPTNSN